MRTPSWPIPSSARSSGGGQAGSCPSHRWTAADRWEYREDAGTGAASIRFTLHILLLGSAPLASLLQVTHDDDLCRRFLGLEEVWGRLGDLTWIGARGFGFYGRLRWLGLCVTCSIRSWIILNREKRLEFDRDCLRSCQVDVRSKGFRCWAWPVCGIAKKIS
jgi:hypothetical protein